MTRFLLAGLLFLTPLLSIQAQADVVLTVTFMDGMEYIEGTGIIEQFEEAHPGVQVHVTYLKPDDIEYTDPIYDLDTHLAYLNEYTALADVLLMSNGLMTPAEASFEATQAGYILDLAPLVQADSRFNPADFYAPIWESVQWDGGTWLLPVTAQVNVLAYDRQKFDALGLSYPDASWSIDDYVLAIEMLTERDSTGQALNPGFIGFNGANNTLFYRLLGQPLYDAGTLPAQPDFTPALPLVEQFTPLYLSGAIYNPFYEYVEEWDEAKIALKLDGFYIPSMNQDENLGIAPLPDGGGALTAVTGFAVSSRTAYPELAYALAKFLAADPRVVDAVDTSTTHGTRARHTYPDVEPIEGGSYWLGRLREENVLLLEETLQTAVPVSEQRYYDRLREVMEQIATTGLDAQAALDAAEIKTRDQLAQAEATTLTGVIPLPPTLTLPPGEIALRFWASSFYPLADGEAWEQFMADFAAADPEVGQVIFAERSASFSTMTAATDCFYTDSNFLFRQNMDLLLPLDPLMQTDARFDPADFLPGVLAQVQTHQQTWVYPLTLQPLVIRHDQPISDWTVTDFIDMLTTLKPEEGATYGSFETAPLLLLAAFGGLPIDVRSTPPTLDFVGAEPAIRQVLDLVKDGVIAYAPLSDNLLSLEQGTVTGDEPFQVQNWYVPYQETRASSTLFPVGSRYAPVSYTLGVAGISAASPYPEACYRLISQLAEQPQLLTSGVPVRTSMQTASTSPIYEQLVTRLNSPSALVFSQATDTTAWIASYWLYRAFDRYVLAEADLLTELEKGEQLARDFLACAVTVEPQPSVREVNRALQACAIAVDPDIASYFVQP